MLGYPVCDSTGDHDDPSVDAVVDRVLTRASSPRDSVHVDRYVSDATDRFGEESVERCVRLILDDGYSHRQAGAAVFGSDEYLWGVNVGSAVSTYLNRWE
jgi:hypothetical protein